MSRTGLSPVPMAPILPKTHPHLKTRSCASIALPCREPLRMPPLPTTAQRTQPLGKASLSKRCLLAEALRSRRVLPTAGREQDGASQRGKGVHQPAQACARLSMQQHSQTSLHKSTPRSIPQESSCPPRAGEGSTGGMGGHQPVPPLPGLVSPPRIPKRPPNSGHLRPRKARGCIQTSPAPAPRMLLPVLAVSPPDNVSLQLPPVHTHTPHCPQHFPAQGLKPAAASKSREWVWGRKGNNLHPQQWSGLSEPLRPQLIIMHTLELLFGENVTRCSKRHLQSRPFRPAPWEEEWEEIKVLVSSAGLLHLPHVLSPLCWAPLELPHTLPSPPRPHLLPPPSRLGPYLRGTSLASHRGHVASSACPKSLG